MTIHVVKPGESIYSIARQYGVPAQKIISDNALANPEQLVPGQTIVILQDNVRHTVARGESLYSIARRYGTNVESILELNQDITDSADIDVGQIITVPVSRKKLGTIEVNGYAFPSISDSTLDKTLPNLTYLSVFSYQVRPDGTLIPIQDYRLINAAGQHDVAPLMVITNIEEGGSFSSELAHTILSSEQVQNTLIDNVIGTMEGRYRGLDIDFEYVFPRDRENYNSFLRKVADRIKPLGYILATAIAPKTSANQRGLLYEAHDYPVHGEVADHVIIMTYEWGYTFGPARAVAPLNLVERVIQYAVTVIPPKKILLGIPNYGYEWTLPFVEGSAARSLSNVGAVARAAEVGARIQFDQTAQSPFFEFYGSDGKQRVVWFEDARSIEAKLLLINEYGLGGASYWTVNNFFPQNWLVLNSMYNVAKV